MKRVSFVLCAAMACGYMLPLSANAAQSLLPAPSRWTLNAAKSDFGGVPGMKSDVWWVLISNGKRFKYDDVMVLDSGQKVVSRWDGPQDGTMRPSPGWPGVKMGYNAADDSMTAEMPDGSVMKGVMALSEDKKVLTIKNDLRSKDGQVAHQTLVYERTK